MSKIILCFANATVLKHEQCYYVHQKNFIDFLSAFCMSYEHAIPSEKPGKDTAVQHGEKRDKPHATGQQQDQNHEEQTQAQLAIPLTEGKAEKPGNRIPIDLPAHIIPLKNYSGHLSAFLTGFGNAFRLYRVVQQNRRARRDVTIAGPGPNTFLIILSLLCRRNVNYVFFIRGDTRKTLQNIYPFFPLHQLVTWIVSAYEARIRSLVASGQARVFVIGDTLAARYNVRREAVKTISPLVDAPFLEAARQIFQNRKTDRKIDREASGAHFRAGGARLLYAGRLSREKNIAALITACGNLKRAGKIEHLEIVGTGPEADTLAAHASTVCPEGSVIFSGFKKHPDEILETYKRNDILCLVSFTEGIPRTIIEALATGMEVVCTRVGGIEGAVGDTVQYVDGFNAEDIEKTLLSCLDTPRDEQKKQAVAKEIGQKFAIETNVDFIRRELEHF